jgi:hypothetical protein
MITRTAALALILLVALAAAAPAQVTTQTGQDNPATEITKAYVYESREGLFRTMMPRGCGEVRRRQYEPQRSADGEYIIESYAVICDQFKQDGAGCGVTAIFGLRSAAGGVPGAEEVVPRLEEQMRHYGVNVVRQTPLSRELPNGRRIEGLEILAAEPESSGQVWLRGLVYEERVYLLTAWKVEGGLWDDAEYQAFFNAFEPLEE